MNLQYQAHRTLFNGYSIEFSPFFEKRIAVGTSQYFGIVGNGQQCILDMHPDGSLFLVRSFDTQDGIYDCAWNEINENQLVSACANGSIKLWDVGSRDEFPLRNYHEHTQEVSGVRWNPNEKRTFVSTSWDGTSKVWDPESHVSLRTFAEHTYCVYNAAWNVQAASQFATCSGDKTVKIWDVGAPFSSMTIPAHNHEILAIDWNKYNSFQVVTGSVDRTIKIWDIRRPYQPVSILRGHSYAVRRLKCSPHDENVIGSVSYDMSFCLWNCQAPNPLVQKYEHHSEFVLGLDFNLFFPGLVATCSWDRKVFVFDVGSPPPSALST